MNTKMQKIVIVGATSAIAQATARALASNDSAFFLAARDVQKMQAVTDDLRTRGATVHSSEFEADDAAQYEALMETADTTLGGYDSVLIAHGVLPDQTECETDTAAFDRAFAVNATSVIQLATLAAQHFEARGSGTLAVISSVAGDRGRQSNYAYGAAKAAVSAFLQGLRQRLHKQGIHVVTIKPGPVRTPMTAHMITGTLTAEPETVARAIVRGMERGSAVVYTPWFWRPIMAIIRAIPEWLFRRLKL